MKAERRHELQVNTLSRMLSAMPDFFNKHGNKLLFGLVVIVALVVVWRWRQSTAAKEQLDLRAQLDLARGYVRGLRMEPGSQRVTLGVAKQAESLLTDCMQRLKEPADQAQAYLVYGDYNLGLAHYPISLEATTQPSLRPEKSPEAYVAEAASAYQTVLDRFGKEKDMAIARRHAHMGLGTVAEDRAFFAQQAKDQAQAKQQFEKAREQYQAVLDDPELPDLLKGDARWHLEQLGSLESPVAIGAAVSRPKPERQIPATLPTSRSTTGPASRPLPTVRPTGSDVEMPATTQGH